MLCLLAEVGLLCRYTKQICLFSTKNEIGRIDRARRPGAD